MLWTTLHTTYAGGAMSIIHAKLNAVGYQDLGGHKFLFQMSSPYEMP